MPHLRLEYSANLHGKVDFKRLFSECHQVLVRSVDAELFRCQSRAIPCDNFYIGDGSAKEAFVYMELILTQGRKLAQLQQAGRRLLEVLETSFSQSIAELNAQISVRVVEFSPDHYSKLEFR